MSPYRSLAPVALEPLKKKRSIFKTYWWRFRISLVGKFKRRYYRCPLCKELLLRRIGEVEEAHLWHPLICSFLRLKRQSEKQHKTIINLLKEPI